MNPALISNKIKITLLFVSLLINSIIINAQTDSTANLIIKDSLINKKATQEILKDTIKPIILPTQKTTNDTLDKTTISKQQIIDDSDKSNTVDSFVIKTRVYSVTYSDQIVKTNGEIIQCKVKSRNLFDITYFLPTDKSELTISCSNVKEIHYANKNIEVIDNNPKKRKKDWVAKPTEKVWDKVIVTENPNDVTSLVEIEKLEVNWESSKDKVTNSSLEKSALTILQRKALKLNANILLITDKKISRSYGELPSIYIKASAFNKPE
jgi:hypothetical protein